MRSSKNSSPRKGYNYASPMGRKTAPRTQSSLDPYKGQKFYEERRAALLKQIENTRMEIGEHEKNGNQT